MSALSSSWANHVCSTQPNAVEMENSILDLVDLPTCSAVAQEQSKRTFNAIVSQFPHVCISQERGSCDGAGPTSMHGSPATSSHAWTRQTTSSNQTNQAPNPNKYRLTMETIKMNPIAPRAPVAFTVTNANAYALLTDFSRAARAAGWTEAQVKEIVAHAKLRDYHHLQCTLAAYTAEYLSDVQF